MTNYTREYPLPAAPEGETLRATLEEALGYPVTDVIESSPVGVTAVGDQLVVRITADKEPTKATWAKVDKLVEAHAAR